MPRIDLNVPFAEKDEAKRLGARWDSDRKVWYVPAEVSAQAFGRWLPREPFISIRSDRYFIARTVKACWKCGEDTSVLGFILPAGHETLEPDDEDEDEEEEVWCRHDAPSIIYYVTDLPPSVSARARMLSRHYRVDFSKTTQGSYCMNHCEHCGMKQGDFEMYCEPQGAFFPTAISAASRIVLQEFAEWFGCNGSAAYGDHLFEYMRRV